MKQPVLLIMCDDLGFGNVGFNGGDRIKTPQLDRLAESSVLLTNLDADGAPDQLYDLDAVRGETTDLIGEHRDLQQHYRQYLEDFLASCRRSHAGADYNLPVDMITPFQEPGGWMAEKV